MSLLRQLIRAKLFIEQNSHLPIGVEHISREAYLSPFHFIRAFKRRFGLTPHRYVRQQRIRRACRFLEESSYNVSEIAWLVGFDSVPSFTAVFRKLTGKSPTEYRKQKAERRAALAAEPQRFIPHCFLMRTEMQQQATQAQKSNFEEESIIQKV